MNKTVFQQRNIILRTTKVCLSWFSFPSPLVTIMPGLLRGPILALCAGFPVCKLPQQPHHPVKITVEAGKGSKCQLLPSLLWLILIAFSVWHPNDQRKRLSATSISQRSQKTVFSQENNWDRYQNTWNKPRWFLHLNVPLVQTLLTQAGLGLDLLPRNCSLLKLKLLCWYWM